VTFFCKDDTSWSLFFTKCVTIVIVDFNRFSYSLHPAITNSSALLGLPTVNIVVVRKRRLRSKPGEQRFGNR